MDEMVIQDKPGIISKIANIFARTEEIDEVDEPMATGRSSSPSAMRQNYRCITTIRRQIVAFEDAMAAANGLKRGEQQILNLSATEPATRQKIVDFMCGVNFSEEGTWEEIGENIYLIVPSNSCVEVAPPTPRASALRN